MLNKDQYNEDAYNDVYAQAAKGAEIKYSTKKKGKSKLLLIFLLLALIGTVGYFVWKNLSPTKEAITKETTTKEATSTKSLVDTDKESSSKKETTSTNEKTQSKETETEESLEMALQKTLESVEEKKSPTATSSSKTDSSTADIVANIASQTSDTKMSPADIARIVQLVTQQMQEEKKVEESKIQSKVKDSLELSLENVETDTLSSEKLVLEPTSSSQKKEASSDSKTNTYNKIVLEKSNNKENLNDELSKLSMEISNVINSDTEKDTGSNSTSTSSYTSSLSQEADTRTKEMRYHIVKKGDTLASIAHKIYGNSQDYIKLYEANPDILRRADQIYIGQRLRIPE